ncbi:hypothetical protein, partial [Sphingorhabdus sp.]|uniref:hypothetical protein n=1 Tax=Sphingorhabdus sp. TaxID=1902408 RepID=UPI003919591C
MRTLTLMLLLSSAMPVMAHADDQQAANQTPAERADETNNDARAYSEIIVTAQKVEENVQDVPIAITAVSGDRLIQAGVISLENISTVVPSV